MGWLDSLRMWFDYQNDDPGTFRSKYRRGEYAGASEDMKRYIRLDYNQNMPGGDPFTGTGERPGKNYSTDDGTACW